MYAGVYVCVCVLYKSAILVARKQIRWHTLPQFDIACEFTYTPHVCVSFLRFRAVCICARCLWRPLDGISVVSIIFVGCFPFSFSSFFFFHDYHSLIMYQHIAVYFHSCPPHTVDVTHSDGYIRVPHITNCAHTSIYSL